MTLVRQDKNTSMVPVRYGLLWPWTCAVAAWAVLRVIGLAGLLAVMPANQSFAQTGQQGSGRPLPRYYSLKSDKVNIRKGPGTNYRIIWVFRRAGLPVEVLKKYQGWRQIRDADGSTGWVYAPMLSGRRTALVLPWAVKPGRKVQTELWQRRSRNSQPLALLQAGVLVNVKQCDRVWCKVFVGDLQGFIEQKKLWGIYPDERVK